jgi:peptide/nickel transport system substrate-binding protein
VAATGGCAGRQRRTPDDTLVVLIPAELRDVDPRFAFTNFDLKISQLLAPGLFSVDNAAQEPEPYLAETIRQVEPLVWEVTLRADARFSDGSPVTARDVEFTYGSTMDPKTQSLFQKGFRERFSAVEAVDARRTRFHLVRPLATLRSDLTFGILSRAGAERGQVVGAGPYQLLTFSPDRVFCQANPHYFGPAPPVPLLEFRVVRDDNARALMLAGGSADLAQNGVRVDLVDVLAKRDRLYIQSGPSNILTYLMMQNRDPVLRDVRVRRAIAHAVDRERIIAAKFHGHAVLASGLLNNSHWAHRADLTGYSYDPERARQLLDQAGYLDLDGPGGEPRLRLSYKTSSDQFRVAIARIIASQLAEVGIEVEIRSFEFNTFFNDIKSGNYQLASMQTGEIADPDFYYTYFHSSRIPSKANPGDHNRWRFANPRLDELTAQGREVIDLAQRRRIYDEVQEIVATEVPIIPLWHEDNIAVMNRDVEGYRVLINGRFTGLAQAAKRSSSPDAIPPSPRADISAANPDGR